LKAKRTSFDAQWRHAAEVLAFSTTILAISVLLPVASLQRLPSLCPIHLAGFPCWGCGLSRGFCALGHGQWQAALGYNRLTPLVYALVCLLAVSSAARLLKRSQPST